VPGVRDAGGVGEPVTDPIVYALWVTWGCAVIYTGLLLYAWLTGKLFLDDGDGP
jgi:hypothetical protein